MNPVHAGPFLPAAAAALAAAVTLATLAAPIPAHAARPAFPELGEADAERLAAGKLVLLRQYDSEQSGTLVGVMRIHATSAAIWAPLLDFARVPEVTPSVQQVTDYTAEMDRTPPAGGRFLDIRFELSVLGQQVIYNIHHTYFAADDHLEWVLDETQDNDIVATVGSWTLFPVAGETDVYDFVYITRVDTGRNVPQWVETLLTKSSLGKYLKWVKGVAEGA